MVILCSLVYRQFENGQSWFFQNTAGYEPKSCHNSQDYNLITASFHFSVYAWRLDWIWNLEKYWYLLKIGMYNLRLPLSYLEKAFP
jgi:hypothetical protein